LKLCFKTTCQGLFGPTGQLVQPAHLGQAKPTRLGSGSVNRPSPALAAHLSLPHRSLWRSGSPPPSPGDSGQLRWPPSPMLGQNGRLHFLYQLLQLETAETSSPRRSGWFSPSETAATNRPQFDAPPSLLSCACCATSDAGVARELADGSAVVWCSR
jgi:hypothetical protein